jgi:hypothetical protein
VSCESAMFPFQLFSKRWNSGSSVAAAMWPLRHVLHSFENEGQSIISYYKFFQAAAQQFKQFIAPAMGPLQLVSSMRSKWRPALFHFLKRWHNLLIITLQFESVSTFTKFKGQIYVWSRDTRRQWLCVAETIFFVTFSFMGTDIKTKAHICFVLCLFVRPRCIPALS